MKTRNTESTTPWITIILLSEMIFIDTSIWIHLSRHQSTWTVHSSLDDSNSNIKQTSESPTRLISVGATFKVGAKPLHSSVTLPQQRICTRSPWNISFSLRRFLLLPTPTCRRQLWLGSSGRTISNQVCGFDCMPPNAVHVSDEH